MKLLVRFGTPVLYIARDDGSHVSVEAGEKLEMSEQEIDQLHSSWFEIEGFGPDEETPLTTKIFAHRLEALSLVAGADDSGEAFSNMAGYPLSKVRGWLSGKAIPMYVWRSLNLLCSMAELNGPEGLVHATGGSGSVEGVPELGLRYTEGYAKRAS